MVAGQNCKVTVWRINFNSDDAVGGAQPTGTAIYTNVLARITPNEPEQLLLQQGLEVPRTFDCTISPGTYTIYERDEIEVTEPFDYHYHNERFRVVGVRYSDFNVRDPRNYILLSLVRSVRAHGSQ